MKNLSKLAVAIAALVVLALPAAAFAHGSDRDHDKLPDRWEARYHVGSATADIDGDGLNALGEFRSRTSPRDADSDNDGVLDGAEDFDGDGIANEDERGFGLARIEDDDIDDADDEDADEEESIDSADSVDSVDSEESADSLDESVDSEESVDEDDS